VRNIKVALAQMSPVLRSKHENISKMNEVVEGNDADLYVFGEMFLTGYSCKDEFHRLAEPLSGESVRAVAKIAEERNATAFTDDIQLMRGCDSRRKCMQLQKAAPREFRTFRGEAVFQAWKQARPD
jgi:hypothetical protein